MILYHGSNTEIREPKLLYSRSSLDFGAGFYMTSDRGQGEKWARRVTKIRETGIPVVSVFELEKQQLSGLSVLSFEKADAEWLKLVVKFRTDQPVEDHYDIITGPVANDRTVDVINQFIAGALTEEIALQLLRPMQFKDQWTFKTEEAIAALVWKEALHL